MKVWWRICQRYNEARYRRALKQNDGWAAAQFKARSEKFCRRIKGDASKNSGGVT